MSESVHALLGREVRVQFEYFVQVHTTIHLAKSERVRCSLQFHPLSDFHSAEHLFKSVRAIFFSEIRLYYRIAIACTRVVTGARCYISFF